MLSFHWYHLFYSTVTSEFKQCSGYSRHETAGTGRFGVCFCSNRCSHTQAQSIRISFPVTLFLRNNRFTFFLKYSNKNGNSIKAVFFYMKVRGGGGTTKPYGSQLNAVFAQKKRDCVFPE